MPKMQKTFLSLFPAQHSTLTIFNMFALLPINPLLSLIISYRELRAKNVRQIAPLIGYLTCKIVPGGSCLLPPWPRSLRCCKFMIHPGPISSLAPSCDIRPRPGQTGIHHPHQSGLIQINPCWCSGLSTLRCILSGSTCSKGPLSGDGGEIARTVTDTSCPGP